MKINPNDIDKWLDKPEVRFQKIKKKKKNNNNSEEEKPKK